MDGAMTKAPRGGENTGPNPTGRAKTGTKRHILSDGNGVPLRALATGANRNDFKETKNVIKDIVTKRPPVTARKNKISVWIRVMIIPKSTRPSRTIITPDILEVAVKNKTRRSESRVVVRGAGSLSAPIVG